MEHFLSSMSVTHPSGIESKENLWKRKALSENNLEDDRIGSPVILKVSSHIVDCISSYKTSSWAE